MIVHNYTDFDDGGYYMCQRYCEVLGVKLDSSKGNKKKAYKRLALFYRPDGDGVIVKNDKKFERIIII